MDIYAVGLMWWYTTPIRKKGFEMNTIRSRNFLIAVVCLAFAMILLVPIQAFATVEGDQTLLTDEEIAQAIAQGQIPVQEETTTLNTETYAMDVSTMASATGGPIKSFSGSDRFQTAALQAKYGWKSSEYVIIVGGDGWPDALSASGLSGLYNCPILLTERDTLNAHASSLVKNLGAKKAIIVGGTAVVGSKVETSLKGMGVTCTRLSGSDRYATQLKVYEHGKSKWSNSMVVVASGEDYADALSAAPLAAKLKVPVFLVGSSGTFTTEQDKALVSGAQSNKLFQSAVVLGGTARIANTTVGYLDAVTSLATGTSKGVKRVSGSDRYATSAAFAEWAVSKGYLKWDSAAFASGNSAADSLGGGALQGKEGSVLLLVHDVANNPGIISAKASKTKFTSVKFFGGKAAVPMTVRMDVADKLGFAYSDIQGLKVYIDAGHGWNSSNNNVMDNGASGNGYTEYDLTKKLSNAVGDKLRSTYGMNVFVNDDGGWYKLRHAEAVSLGCDLFVSIHFNAGGAKGTESYIHSYNRSWKSADLQSKAHAPLVSALGQGDRGKKTAEFAVIGGRLPAVLLEICFIDNSSDMSAYSKKSTAVANAIAKGIAS